MAAASRIGRADPGDLVHPMVKIALPRDARGFPARRTGHEFVCRTEAESKRAAVYVSFTALVGPILSIEVQDSICGTGRSPGVVLPGGWK
jgi:hypothetical protein